MAELRPRPGSVADVTRAYIDDHPSLREGLADDLVNFTALARKIQSETGIALEEAVTIACRRYQRGLSEDSEGLRRIRAIVGRSRLEVHSRVAIVRIRDDWETLDQLLALGRRTLAEPSPRRVFQMFQGTRALTVLCEEGFLATLLEAVPEPLVLGVERGLATLALRSDPEVARTPGVLAYLVEALYRRGINCLETVSVHTDSIFVFRDADVIRAYQALSEILPPRAEPAPASPGESPGEHA